MEGQANAAPGPRSSTPGALQAILYSRDAGLQLLDQRLLPFQQTYLPVPTVRDAWQQIRDMVVRGAPAIGVAGALALAVHVYKNGELGRQYASAQHASDDVRDTMAYLVTSRPTAVNLADSAARLTRVAAEAAARAGATAESVAAAVVADAEATLVEDVAANRAIGAHGARALLDAVGARKGGVRGGAGGKPVRVLTHCNTGSLATAGFGTALGVVRALHEQGRLEHAYCTETRPYNQGARLTAFELAHDGLPATLICDSAAAAAMALGKVDAVVVGADRVAANGDAANKIGTYSLAIAARFHGVPFFVAAPTTTLDPDCPDGASIEIEQRPAEEITHAQGKRVAAEGVGVWNPCFDATPGSLVDAVVTELGVVPRALAAAGEGGGKGGAGFVHDVPGFLARHGVARRARGGTGAAAGEGDATASAAPGGSGSGHEDPGLSAAALRAYVAARPALAAAVGGGDPASWNVREVGDGNLNFIYLVTPADGGAGAGAGKGQEGEKSGAGGGAGDDGGANAGGGGGGGGKTTGGAPVPALGLAIKHSVPYVRVVGEGWPLSQERARIEADALELAGALAPPGAVPRVLSYDPSAAILALELVPNPPAVVLRHAIERGAVLPGLVPHVASYLARTLFGTSLFALDSPSFRRQATRFANPDLCALTERVIFTEPYVSEEWGKDGGGGGEAGGHPNNRHNRACAAFERDVAAIRADPAARAAALALKRKFSTEGQAVLHGDLHTGSFMVAPSLEGAGTGGATNGGADGANGSAASSSSCALRVVAFDPEFAFVGPIAFDVGTVIGELLISYFAADGREQQEEEKEKPAAAAAANGPAARPPRPDRASQRRWLLRCAAEVWERFADEFDALWAARARRTPSPDEQHGGAAVATAGTDLAPPALFGPADGAAGAAGPAALAAAQASFRAALLSDTLAFAGAVVVRRLIGIAHTVDMDGIEDPARRAACERRALAVGRALLVGGAGRSPQQHPTVRSALRAAAAARLADGLADDGSAAVVAEETAGFEPEPASWFG
jgi:5-methylthioribose kinase